MGGQAGYWLGEGGAQELAAGQVIVLSPLREGCFRASQLGPLTLHYFRFSPEVAGCLLTPSEHDIFEALARKPQIAVRCFAPDTPGPQAWTQLLSDPARDGGLWERVELLRILVLLFMKELRRPAQLEQTFLPARLKLRLLLNRIPETEFLRLTPHELAAHCGVSVAQASRSFRKMFGHSLGERQELIRLQKARQTLTETSESLDAVAAEAGYAGTRPFVAAFKKHFGVSPEEWRRPRMRRAKVPTLPRHNGDPLAPQT